MCLYDSRESLRGVRFPELERKVGVYVGDEYLHTGMKKKMHEYYAEYPEVNTMEVGGIVSAELELAKRQELTQVVIEKCQAVCEELKGHIARLYGELRKIDDEVERGGAFAKRVEEEQRVKESDLEVNYFRSSVCLNVNDTCAVKLTHVPTGTVGIGASYAGNNTVVRRKNYNIAYRNLLMELDKLGGTK